MQLLVYRGSLDKCGCPHPDQESKSSASQPDTLMIEIGDTCKETDRNEPGREYERILDLPHSPTNGLNKTYVFAGRDPPQIKIRKPWMATPPKQQLFQHKQIGVEILAIGEVHPNLPLGFRRQRRRVVTARAALSRIELFGSRSPRAPWRGLVLHWLRE